MNAKILIVTLLVFYLSWETSAAAVDGGNEPEVAGGNDSEIVGGDKSEVIEGDKSEVNGGDNSEAEVIGGDKAIAGSFKCRNLECPNGSFCEIRQKPTDDGKSVRITTQCRSANGTILKEENTTEEVPEGVIPVTSFSRKTLNGDNYGAYYGGSYVAKSFGSAKVGDDGVTEINFVPVDGVTDSELGFGKIWSDIDEELNRQREVFKKTGKLFERLFGNWSW